jgi:hypothetical protein
LIIGIVEPARIENSSVLLPEQLAVRVVAGEDALRAEERDDVFAVGGGRRGGVRPLRVAFGLRQAFERDAIPDDFARRLVYRHDVPRVLRFILDGFDIAVESVTRGGLGLCADGGGHIDAIAPHDRA